MGDRVISADRIVVPARRGSLASLTVAIVVAALAAAVLLLAPGTAEAVDRVSVTTSGNWGTASSWSGSAVPTSADRLAIGTTSGGGASPSTITLGSGNGQSNELQIGGSNIVAGAAGTGTLNLSGGSNLWNNGYLYLGGTGTAGTNNGTLSVTNATMNTLNGIYAARYSTNGVATISLDNATFNNQGAADQTYLSFDATGARATVNLTNGSVFNIGNTGGGTAATVYFGGTNSNSKATVNIDATSRMNVGLNGSLFFRGGDTGDATVINGTTGFARYTLPLSNTMANGSLSQSRNIYVADQANNKAALTLDSTLAAGQRSAATLNQFGSLFVGTNTSSNAAITLNAVNAGFYGGSLQVAQGSSSVGTLNLTNSTLFNGQGGLELARGGGSTANVATVNLTGSTLRARDSLFIGVDNSNFGTAALNLDSLSRIQLNNGGIYLRGAASASANQVYNFAVTSTPTNGKVSFEREFRIADSSNNRATFNLTAANGSTNLNNFSGLSVGSGSSSNGVLNVTGLTYAMSAGDVVYVATGSSAVGTLALDAATVWNRNGGASFGTGGGATTNVATITLTNASTLRVRDGLTVGGDNVSFGSMALSIGNDSRVVLENGSLILKGGNGNSPAANQAYSFAITDTPTNGKLSFDRGLYVANSNSNRVTLNLTTANGSTSMQQYGPLVVSSGNTSSGVLNVTGLSYTGHSNDINVATGASSAGTLTLDAATIDNRNGSLNFGTGGTATTNVATITLTNGSTLRTRNSLTVGGDNVSFGSMALSIGSDSRVVLENGSLTLRGGNGNSPAANQVYNFAITDTPTNGKLSFDGGLYVANKDTNRVTLNLTAANGSTSMQQYGPLQVGTGNGANTNGVLNVAGLTYTGHVSDISVATGTSSSGTLTLDAATIDNRNGSLNFGTGGTATTNVATITLTNGSTLRTRNSLTVGGENVSFGSTALSIGSDSRVVLENGSLTLRGGNGNSPAANQAYSFAITDTPTNGKLSFNRGLFVAGTNDNRVTLDLTAANGSTSMNQFGALQVAQGGGTNTNGVLNVTGITTAWFSNNLNVAGGSNASGTLSLSNASVLNRGGTLELSRGGSANNLATVTLANSSTLYTRDDINIGADNTALGRASLSIDGTSQIVSANGTLRFRGGNNASDATYSLSVADSFAPGAGKLAFRSSLSVSDSTSNRNAVTFGSGSSAVVNPSGGVYLGTGSTGLATLNLDTLDLQFAADGSWASQANSRATVSLTNGAELEVNNGLTMRSSATTTAATTLTMSGGSTSRLDAGTTFTANGRIVVNTGGVLNVDFGNTTTNVTNTTNVVQGDASLAGLVVNAGTAGQIVPKSIRGLATGAATNVTWGQNWTESGNVTSGGAAPLTVNAMQVQFASGNVSTTGDLAIALVDPASFTTGAEKVVGAFALQGANGLALGTGPTLAIRYDTTRATALAVTEANLKVYQLVGGAWNQVAATVDTTNKRITTSAALNTALGNVVISDAVPGGTTEVTFTPYVGTRAAGTTDRYNTATGNWSTSGNWTEVSPTVPRRTAGPEGRDNVEIGSSALTSAAVTLDNALSTNKVRDLRLGEIGGGTGGSLTVTNGSALRVTQFARFAAAANSSTATLSINGGSSMRIDQGNVDVATTQSSTGSLLLDNGRLEIASTLQVARGTSSVGTITLANGSAIDVRGGLTLGGNGVNTGRVTLTIDATSRFDVLQSLTLDGGNSGEQAYTLPLAGIGNSAAGKMTFGSTLSVASTNNNNVRLNLDSTLAAGQAADTAIRVNNQLYVAEGNTATGTLSLNAVNMDFGGTGSHRIAGNANRSTGSLLMTDSTVRLMGGLELARTNDTTSPVTTANLTLTRSVLDVRGGLTFGGNGVNSPTLANITLDGSSQINLLGDLNVQGNAGTNASQREYTLPITGTPTAGKLSFRNSLFVGETNNNNVRLNMTAATGSTSGIYEGLLYVARGSTATGVLNVDGVNVDFSSTGTNQIASNTNATGSLLLTDSTVRLFGGLDMSKGSNSTTNLTLVRSRLDMRGNADFGNNNVDAQALANISLDGTSQLNILSQLSLGGNAGNSSTQRTYTLPITDTPTNGKLSFRTNLLVGAGTRSNTRLNMTAATGSTNSIFEGNLFLADGGGDEAETAVLNVDGINLTFGGGTTNRLAANSRAGNATLLLTDAVLSFPQSSLNIATAGNNNATITLTRSRLDVRGDVSIGGPESNSTSATITIDSASQFNSLGALSVNGSGGNSSTQRTYTLPLTDTPTDGKLSFRTNLNVAATARNNIRLNITAAGGATNAVYQGGLFIADGGSDEDAVGLVNVDGVNLDFAGAGRIAASSKADTGTLQLTNARVRLMSGSLTMATNDGSAGTVTLATNSTLDVRGSLTIGVSGTAQGRGTVTLDATSRIDILNDLALQGGNTTSGTTILGQTGWNIYTLPLAGPLGAGAGRMSIGGSLSVANTNNNKVSLTVDSTLAAGQAAATDMSLYGNLAVAGGSSSYGQFVLKGTTVRFNGTGNLAQNTSAVADISLTNAGLEVYGAFNARSQTNAQSRIVGTGSITVAGTITNNGRIEANGGALMLRASDLTSGVDSAFTGTQALLGQAGWFAFGATVADQSTAGILTLPDQFVSSTSNSTWGDLDSDTTPDMVNSMRFSAFTNLQPGVLRGSVRDPVAFSLAPALQDKVSAWSFTGLSFNAATLVFRYDDARATSLGLTQADLKLWQYQNNTTWVDITGSVDTTNKWITSSSSVSGLGDFVVSTTVPVPEPGTTLLGAMGACAAGLLLRSRRNRRAARGG